MTSGTQLNNRLSQRPRRPAHAAAVAAFLLAAAVPAWGFDVKALAALLAQQRNAEARFTEQRFVSGFDQPLLSSGTLSFKAPDRFSRVTLQPRAESMTVQGSQVTLVRSGRTRQMTLDAVPEAVALVEAMRGTLNGDLVTLQKHFKTQVDGTETRWRLTLRPLNLGFGSQIQQLALEGQGPELKTVEVLLAGGDRSFMTLENLPATKPTPAAASPARP